MRTGALRHRDKGAVHGWICVCLDSQTRGRKERGEGGRQAAELEGSKIEKPPRFRDRSQNSRLGTTLY